MRKKIVDRDKFIDICKKSQSMAQAAAELGMQFSTFKRYAEEFGCYNTNQSGKGIHKANNGIVYDIDSILNNEHPGYSTNRLKKKLFKDGRKECKCECCGIKDWNGKPLNMELHHIDGNPNNNNIENLQILCPNCHSQTDNFRGKNKR